MITQQILANVIKPWRLVGIFILACSTVASTQIIGSGNLESQLRASDLFTTLIVELPADVEVVCQSLPRIEITADQNLLNHIETKVWGNELRIKATADIRPSHQIKIKIGTAFLHKLETAIGEHYYRVSDIKTSFFELVNFSGKVILEGQAEELNLMMENGHLYADDLRTQKAHAEIWGGGAAVVQVSGELSGVLTRGSQVMYLQEPQRVKASLGRDAQMTGTNELKEDFQLERRKDGVMDRITGVQKLPPPTTATDELGPVAGTRPKPSKKEYERVSLVLVNNSGEKIDVNVVGPPGDRFDYGVPFRAGQERLENLPVGTRVYLVRRFWFNELLVTIQPGTSNFRLNLFDD
ncbi:MAG: DUF2807 domain-containing protein [Bacteroidota bacterium]